MGRGPAFWPGSWTAGSPSQMGREGVLPALVLGARGGFGGEGKRGDSWGERRRVRLLAARRAARAKRPVSTRQHPPASRPRPASQEAAEQGNGRVPGSLDERPLPGSAPHWVLSRPGQDRQGTCLESEDNTSLVPSLPLHPRASQVTLAGTNLLGLSGYIWKMEQITLHETIKCLIPSKQQL